MLQILEYLVGGMTTKEVYVWKDGVQTHVVMHVHQVVLLHVHHLVVPHPDHLELLVSKDNKGEWDPQVIVGDKVLVVQLGHLVVWVWQDLLDRQDHLVLTNHPSLHVLLFVITGRKW